MRNYLITIAGLIAYCLGQVTAQVASDKPELGSVPVYMDATVKVRGYAHLYQCISPIVPWQLICPSADPPPNTDCNTIWQYTFHSTSSGSCGLPFNLLFTYWLSDASGGYYNIGEWDINTVIPVACLYPVHLNDRLAGTAPMCRH